MTHGEGALQEATATPSLVAPGPAPMVYNITVAPPPLVRVHLGDADSLGRYVRSRDDVVAAVWDETGARILLRDTSHVLTYRPEITAEAEQFFHREEKREKTGAFELGPKVWEGDFEPVKFRRRDLKKFLAAHSTDVPEGVVASLDRLKRTESEEESGGDGQTLRTVSVRELRTNLPHRFGVTLEVLPGIATTLQFEARTCALEGRYGRETGSMGVELRCTNAREVLRRAVQGALGELPESVPRYYGRSPPPGERGGDRGW